MNERQRLAAAIAGRMAWSDTSVRGLVDVAIGEGVAALLGDSHASATLEPDERRRLNGHIRAEAVCLAAVDLEVARVLDMLADEGVRPLLLKGAHLAHAVYPKPWLRPRADTDLLIEVADRDRFAAAIERSGYTPAPHVRGRVILGQFHFERLDRSGVSHYLDVHWRVAAPLLIERLLPAHRFFDSATALPALGPHARTPDLPHALLLACVHLVAHHRSNPLLVWLYDLRLLAEALDEHERDAFVELARRVECCAIAGRALNASREVFDSPALDHVIARVDAAAPRRETSAALLAVRRPAGGLWIDLRTANWRDRAMLLREHLLPNREYMRTRSSGRRLPFAYAGRAARGLRRWTRKY